MERGVGGDRHRQGWPGWRRAHQGPDRVRVPGIGGDWAQQGPKRFKIQVAPCQLHPDRLPLPQIVQILGGQETQMAGGELQGGVVRQHPQQGDLNAGQGLLQQGPVPLAAHPVEHHPG